MRSNEKFTQRAEYAIEKGGSRRWQYGAQLCRHGASALGILLEDSGVGARVRGRRGITESARGRPSRRLTAQERPPAPEHRLTLRAKQAFERAAVEAEALGQNYIGTEHLSPAFCASQAAAGCAFWTSWERI